MTELCKHIGVILIKIGAGDIELGLVNRFLYGQYKSLKEFTGVLTGKASYGGLGQKRSNVAGFVISIEEMLNAQENHLKMQQLQFRVPVMLYICCRKVEHLGGKGSFKRF